MQRNQLIIRVVVFCCVALDPSCGASEIVAGRQAEADGGDVSSIDIQIF